MVGRRAAAGLASAWRSPYARAAVGAASRLRPRLAPEGAILILLIMVVGTFSIEAISPFDPLVGQPRERLQGPEWAWDFWNVHILGTDQQGRDVFVRLLVGARFSLLVAALTVGIAGFVGLALGMVAGYYRGAVEAVLMRLTDAVLALPIILLALVLGVVYRPSITLVIIALSANLWAGYARMIRGETLSVMNRDFIRLARVAGAGPVRIIVHHIFPHVKNTFIVLLTLQFGVAISGRVVAQLPRRGHTAAGPILGVDGLARPPIHRDRLVGLGLPRPGDPPRRLELQYDGRLDTRQAGPQPPAVRNATSFTFAGTQSCLTGPHSLNTLAFAATDRQCFPMTGLVNDAHAF